VEAQLFRLLGGRSRDRGLLVTAGLVAGPCLGAVK
jgi:hypothetical protein